ncbi:MAG: acyl-CoA dehydrogenase family protein, partial [Pseudomonadota bacterium]
ANSLGDDNKDVDQLQSMAFNNGLWGQFFPQKWGGTLHKLQDYLLIGYEEGRTEFAPTIFGGLATVDAYMLEHYGSGFIHQQFLQPLSEAKVSSAYAMTEPDQPGSIPATLCSTATFQNGQWVINGRKWFICNARKADYVTILTCTDKQAPLSERFTLFVVPCATRGCNMVSANPVFGRFLGQGEYCFDNLHIEDKYRLGELGQGLEIMQSRVTLGRLMRAIHWLGLADRCLELSYQRIHSQKGQIARLKDKQLIKQHIFDSYAAIESAKLLLKNCAEQYDNHEVDASFINMTKVVAAKALCKAADSALQIYGAEGVSNQTPIASIYQVARTTRILDGADEALINAVGSELIRKHAHINPADAFKYQV